MQICPRFTKRRRALQLAKYGLLHGVKVFEKLNSTNLALARQFSQVTIDCNVCGATSQVWFEMNSVREMREHRVGLLRETVDCLNCLSRTRYRVMAFGLLAECRARFGVDADDLRTLAPRIGHIDILDTDAFSPASRILNVNASYKKSSYVPASASLLLEDQATYNVNLEAMPFDSRSFDVIMSSDVLEHVRNFRQANLEILRCLKPGGVHIFTVPFADPPLGTKTLIDASSAKDIYLEQPQWHGDDHLAGKVATYRIYGWDLIDDLRALGFEASSVKIEAPGAGIYAERYFIARRPLGARSPAKPRHSSKPASLVSGGDRSLTGEPSPARDPAQAA